MSRKDPSHTATSARALELRANKQAELFVETYYSVYDSPSRNDKLPGFYRADAQIVWNGNAIAGPTALNSLLLSKLSFTKHEVQSFDAHVIPGSIMPPPVLPTISITITGQVMLSSTPFPANFRMPDPKDISLSPNPGDKPPAMDGLPRVYSQTFILAPSPTTTEPAPTPVISNYSIIADCLRFVG